MSRVGKNPVKIPSGVDVSISGSTISAKGPKGQLSYTFTADVKVEIKDNQVVVTPASDSLKANAMWGTSRARINNLVNGVHVGFSKNLELLGVGYRASVKEKTLVLQLGFSHDINYDIPEGIEIKCEKPTALSVFGADIQKVGQVAAEIRSYRKPEPYKGKGVRYAGEYIPLKVGKKK